MNSTQLALKLAARKALIIRSSGYLLNTNQNGLADHSHQAAKGVNYTILEM
ncbi:hypothetical protein [Pseudoalteromonas sp. HM-SA03]|uniref:hypothetical protein n=1 Tax=Pseudoalteromonas sp. HM-SA03 TaxID=2029678 RepID=UPI001595D22D|nr:hypothetical protein [Pseudoalteromonas sp. HM-SA03]